MADALAILKRAYELHKVAKAEARKKDAYFKVALAFNKIHSFVHSWHEPRWMCPTCHKVHEPTQPSVFVGWLYPKCCEFPEGERHSRIYATQD
jgi:hypothetical protein